MKCPYCDYENKPTSRFCENCGAQLISDEGKEEQVHEYGGAAPEPSSYAEDVFSGTAEDAGHDGFNQYGGQESPYQQADMPQGYGMPPVTPKKKNSKLGIAVLILGFLGMTYEFILRLLGKPSDLHSVILNAGKDKEDDEEEEEDDDIVKVSDVDPDSEDEFEEKEEDEEKKDDNYDNPFKRI